MTKYDRLLTIGLIIIEVCYFILIKTLPEKAAKYPYFILGLLVILTIILGIKSFLLKGDKEEKPFNGFQMKQFLFVVGVSVIYLFLIDWIGFFVTTFVYLIVVMLGLKTNIKWTVISSTSFCILIYFVFVVFLKVPIPKGVLT